MKIILASSSPRRKALLGLVIPNFEICPSEIEEKLVEGLSPKDQAINLSYIKAKDIFEKTSGDRIIVGSDTIVTKNGKIYGKPKNKESAKLMIRELIENDNVHSVITGLTILIEENGKYEEYKTYDETKIYLKDMTDPEIEKWINTGKAMDKAGAYAIQEEFGVFVDKMEGNYTTVVGLPIHKVYDILKKYIDI